VTHLGGPGTELQSTEMLKPFHLEVDFNQTARASKSCKPIALAREKANEADRIGNTSIRDATRINNTSTSERVEHASSTSGNPTEALAEPTDT